MPRTKRKSSQYEECTCYCLCSCPPKKPFKMPDLCSSYNPDMMITCCAENINRNCLSQESYMDMLATPKGYCWVGGTGRGLVGPRTKKKKLKVKRRVQKVMEEPEPPKYAGDFANDFVEDMWDVMNPEISNRLIDFLINEFGMGEEEAEDFVETKRAMGKQTVSKKKPLYYKTDLGSRHKWLKEFSGVFAKRIEEYIICTLETRRTPRVKRIAEKILEYLCYLTGEKTTLHSAKTKCQKTMVLIADRLALWINDIMKDIDKPQKKRPVITEEEKSLEESEEEQEPKIEEEPQEKPDEEEKEKPKDIEKEPAEKEPKPEEKDTTEEQKEEEPKEGDPKEEERKEEAPKEEEPKEEESKEEEPKEEESREEEPKEEEPKEEEPTLDEEEKVPEKEMEKPVPDETAEVAEETPAEETPAEETPAEETPAEETPAEDTPAEETPAEETPAEQTPAEETPDEETPAEETPAETIPAEETPAEETPAEETPAEEIPAEEEPVEEEPPEKGPPSEQSVGESKEEEKVPEEEEKSPKESEVEKAPSEVPKEEEKEFGDVLDLIKGDIAKTPKDKKTDRQRLVKEQVDKRIEQMLDGNEGIIPEDVDDAASRVAHWIDQIIGATEPKKAPAVRKSPGTAFEVKAKTGSTLEVHKLSSGTVAEVAAQAKGLEIPPRRKIPHSNSPMNMKSAQEWADWATNIANVADEWGKWLESTLTDAEKQIGEKKADWKEWREQAQHEAIKWRVEKERIKDEGKFWDKKIEQLKAESEIEVKSTELSK